MIQNNSSRRAFLRKTAIASASVALFSGSAISAVLEDPSQGLGYNSFAPFKVDLRKSYTNIAAVKVQGVLFDKTTLMPISNAKIEVWHISPNSNKIKHRAYFYTDQQGGYTFVTDFPDHEPQLKPRIQFRLSYKGNYRFNELIFDTHQAYISHKQYKEYKALGPDFYPQLTRESGSFSIQFNQSL